MRIVVIMKPIVAAVLSGMMLPLTACGGAADGAGGITVVTSAYPLEYVAQRIAGDRAQVVDLVPPGREPHDAELSVAQTAEVADADLVLRVAGLAPAVDDAVAQEADPEADLEALAVLGEHASGG